jgi:hypothetical protein
VSVTRDARGWKAAFRIPFSQWRFETGKRDTFGFAVVREIGRLNETSLWPLIARSCTGFVSQLGELGGLQLSGGRKRLELVPDSVGQVPTQPTAAGNPFEKSPDPEGAVGADIKNAVTPGFAITASINPDFGQVEADPPVVNLAAFETGREDVTGSGRFRFRQDVGGMFGIPANNVFLVTSSYWLNL